MIVYVTPDLTKVLSEDEMLFKQCDTAGHGLSDREHLAKVAAAAVKLVQAVNGATAAVDLIGRTPVGARFETSSDSMTGRGLENLVSFLQTEVRDALSAPEPTRSRSSAPITAKLLERFEALHHMILSGIANRTREDLRMLRDTSAVFLIEAAQLIAERAEDAS